MNKKATTIEQSKKLEEILPLDSADMHYNNASLRGVKYVDNYRLEPFCYTEVINADWASVYKNHNHLFEVIPAWSLSALLTILHFPSLHKTISGWRCDTYNSNGSSFILGENADNPVDACVEMILKLHELNLL